MFIGYTNKTKEATYAKGIDADKLNSKTLEEILDTTVKDHEPMQSSLIAIEETIEKQEQDIVNVDDKYNQQAIKINVINQKNDSQDLMIESTINKCNEQKTEIINIDKKYSSAIQAIKIHDHDNKNIIDCFVEKNNVLYYKDRNLEDAGQSQTPSSLQTKVLFEGGAHTEGTFYLNESYKNYKFLLFQFFIANKGEQIYSQIYNTQYVILKQELLLSLNYDNNYFNFNMNFLSNTSFKINSIGNSPLWNSRSISKVIGIK